MQSLQSGFLNHKIPLSFPASGASRQTSQRAINKQHEVFEPSIDWKECGTEKFIEQKLNYIHWNPCKGNKLVELPEQYVHSSAKFYIENEQGIYAVTSYMELRDINLTNSRR